MTNEEERNRKEHARIMLLPPQCRPYPYYARKDKLHYWTLEDTIKETERLAEQLPKISLKDMVLKKLEYMPDWFKNHVAYVEVSNYIMEK